MKIELQNVNTNKLYDELIQAGLNPISVTWKDSTTWVEVEDSQHDAVMAVVAVHNPTTPSINDIKSQLAELDVVLPRCIEDIITANGTDVTKLPQIMQDRMTQKQSLRLQLQQLITAP